MSLYELAVQVVPLMSRLIALLGVSAFFVSLFVVSDTFQPSSLSGTVVLAGLCGSMGLLGSQIWRRFSRPAVTPTHP